MAETSGARCAVQGCEQAPEKLVTIDGNIQNVCATHAAMLSPSDAATAEQPTATVPAATGAASEQPKRPFLLWIAGVAVLALAGGGFFLFSGGGEADEDDAGSALTADQVFALQTNCFNAGLFYDEDGVCYETDPALMTEEERAASSVPAPGPDATTTSSTDPDSSEDEATDDDSTATSGAAAAPASTTSTSQAPAAPTSSPAAGASSSTSSTTTTTTTTTTVAPVNIAESEWTVRLTPLNEVADGQTFPCDPGAGNRGPHCADALDRFTAYFGVTNGTVSGSKRDSQLEKTVTTTGTIAGTSVNNLSSAFANSGGTTEASANFSNASLAGQCDISGAYVHKFTGSNWQIEGTFTMSRNAPGC